MQTENLIFDVSNVLHRTFFAQTIPLTEEELVGLAAHSALTTLNKYYKQHRQARVIMAFDRPSWRKQYTASELCLSGKLYKGNRRQDMTPEQRRKYDNFLNHLSNFETMIRTHTAITTLVGDGLEADDLIAGFVQMNPNAVNVIISSDSDLLQLAKFENTCVISPATDKVLELSEFFNDAEYYLFQKCVRGDPTDNVQSAFPRVRSTKIRAAYEDPYKMVELMKERWTDHRGIEFVVEDMFAENQLLIDLEKQPDPIRVKITTIINDEFDREKHFSMFHFLKFVGKYELNKIKDSIDLYLPMLS